MDQRKLHQWLKKYRYVLLILFVGLIFMLLPESVQEPADIPAVQSAQPEDMEMRLEQILSRIQGAGEVAVMLTESTGEQIIYQSDDGGTDTVLITAADRSEQGLIRSREPPEYLGAIVVCTGADNAAVRLALVEAVANVTGLGTDRITVLKME